MRSDLSLMPYQERAEKEKEEKRRKVEEGEEDDEKEDDDESSDEEEEGMEVEEDDDEEEEAEEEEEEGNESEEDDEEKDEAGKGAAGAGGKRHKGPAGEGEGKGNAKAERGPLSLVGTTPRAKSIEELRERLRLRIEEARARRGGTPGGKRNAKGQTPQQQKKKTGMGSAGGQNPPHSQQQQQQAAAGGSPGAKPGGLQRRPSEQALDIQFGKIAMPAQGGERLRLKKGGKNLVGLLQKAEEKERRLKELQASEDGKEEANAILWKDALKSAHGEKTLDNPKVRCFSTPVLVVVASLSSIHCVLW